MKALVSKKRWAITLFLMFFVPLFVTVQANAHGYHCYHHRYHHGYGHCRGHCKVYPPVALCNMAPTNSQLPPYVCCEKHDSRGHDLFHDTWVSGSCSAVGGFTDWGCKFNSPVYGTNAPIRASCLFSASTGVYR